MYKKSKLIDFGFNSYHGTIQGYVAYIVHKCNSNMAKPVNNDNPKVETLIIDPPNRNDYG